MTTAKKPVVAIAGASGFIGANLWPTLTADFDVIALARTARPSSPGVTWRACDLFSSTSTHAALAGADVAVYLVHSMMPSSRLFQGNFHDTDLLLADNFAKAAARAGVKHIVYLGGLVPETGFVSTHLQSRLEVELVLQASGCAVTCLRAGMIVGPGGSSFEILRALVQRLPWMILPKWTRSSGQAVFIDDVLAVLRAALTDPSFRGRTFDLVNGEALNYEMMMKQTAAALGKKRLMLPVPIASTGFSKRWVQLFSGASFELIAPLVDSLQCDLPQLSPAPEIARHIRYFTFARMLEETLRRSENPPRKAAAAPQAAPEKTVRSIQRLPSLPEHDAHFISSAYMSWLPRFFRTVIRVARVPGTPRVHFSLALLRTPLLVLELIDQGADSARDKFHIVGGLLTKTTTTGWLEFRQIAKRRYTLAAIHGFVPSLPWLLYLLTQAPIHAWTMHSFGRYLRTLKGDSSSPSAQLQAAPAEAAADAEGSTPP